MKLAIIGLTFALILGVSISWFFVGQRTKEATNKINSIILITVAVLITLVSLALSLIVIWPPIDVLSASLSIIIFVILEALGIFIFTTQSR